MGYGFLYQDCGYFGDSDSNLKYQDEVHGSLMEQIDKAVDLVYTKYKNFIHN